MFFLCTYIDSDRWSSAFEPLLYPTGISFYRPFSYREGYFHPIQTAQLLSDQAQCDALLKQPSWNRGFFGIRFSRDDAFVSRFVPLRKISLTGVRSANVLNLHFRLGPFVNPVLDQGKRRFRALDLNGAVPDLKETKLFIDAPKELVEAAEALETNDEFPVAFWDAFEEQLSPAAWEKVRNAFVLRLTDFRPRGKNHSLAARKIDSASQLYGYSLRAGSAYDLTLSHYRIIQRGQDVPATEFQFVLGNPQEEISSSKRMLQLLGNYRDNALWVKPQISTEGPIELAFESTRLDQPTAFVDSSSSRMIGLKIPTVFTKKHWPTMRWVNLGLFLLAPIVVFALYRRYYVTADDKTQKWLLIVMAALVSLAITSFKDLFSSKE